MRRRRRKPVSPLGLPGHRAAWAGRRPWPASPAPGRARCPASSAAGRTPELGRRRGGPAGAAAAARTKRTSSMSRKQARPRGRPGHQARRGPAARPPRPGAPGGARCPASSGTWRAPEPDAEPQPPPPPPRGRERRCRPGPADPHAGSSDPPPPGPGRHQPRFQRRPGPRQDRVRRGSGRAGGPGGAARTLPAQRAGHGGAARALHPARARPRGRPLRGHRPGRGQLPRVPAADAPRGAGRGPAALRRHHLLLLPAVSPSFGRPPRRTRADRGDGRPRLSWCEKETSTRLSLTQNELGATSFFGHNSPESWAPLRVIWGGVRQ